MRMFMVCSEVKSNNGNELVRIAIEIATNELFDGVAHTPLTDQVGIWHIS
jgi:hypothetical protein